MAYAGSIFSGPLKVMKKEGGASFCFERRLQPALMRRILGMFFSMMHALWPF
jgi:hypothetical protein